MIYKFVQHSHYPLRENISDFPRKLKSTASFFKLSAVIGKHVLACMTEATATYFEANLKAMKGKITPMEHG
jgi:hypothetical protein